MMGCFSGRVRASLATMILGACIHWSHADHLRIAARDFPIANTLDDRSAISEVWRALQFGTIGEMSDGGAKHLPLDLRADLVCSDGETLQSDDLEFSRKRCSFSVAEADQCPVVRRWAAEIFADRLGENGLGVGCGPFRLTEYNPGRSAQFQLRTPNLGKVDRVSLVKLLPDRDAVSDLRSGEIDLVVNPTTEERSAVAGDPTLVIVPCARYTVATRSSVSLECGSGLRASSLGWKR